MIELVRPTLQIKEIYMDFINEWELSGEKIIPFSANLQNMDFLKWLDRTYQIENKETCPSELVPAHTYFLVEDNKKILGAVNIRHTLNEYLFIFGGHIGYGVRPSERKKGYANRMLSLALIEAGKLGIDKVLVTCDKDNIGSAKTIQKNGGILENEIKEEGKLVQRYWIKL